MCSIRSIEVVHISCLFRWIWKFTSNCSNSLIKWFKCSGRGKLRVFYSIFASSCSSFLVLSSTSYYCSVALTLWSIISAAWSILSGPYDWYSMFASFLSIIEEFYCWKLKFSWTFWWFTICRSCILSRFEYGEFMALRNFGWASYSRLYWSSPWLWSLIKMSFSCLFASVVCC